MSSKDIVGPVSWCYCRLALASILLKPILLLDQPTCQVQPQLIFSVSISARGVFLCCLVVGGATIVPFVLYFHVFLSDNLGVVRR